MATAESPAADDEELKRKTKMEEEKEQYIRQIQDELNLPISDPIKESTVDYYLKNKDKVRLFVLLMLLSSCKQVITWF